MNTQGFKKLPVLPNAAIGNIKHPKMAVKIDKELVMQEGQKKLNLMGSYKSQMGSSKKILVLDDLKTYHVRTNCTNQLRGGQVYQDFVVAQNFLRKFKT